MDRVERAKLYDGARGSISVRLADKGDSAAKAQTIATIIDTTERATGGSFFRVADTPWYFDGDSRRALQMVQGGRTARVFASHVVSRYGVSSAHHVGRDVFERVLGIASKGPQREAHRFAHFTGKVLYLSGYNGTVWRLDGEITTPIDNGAEIFFIDDDGGVPCLPNFAAPSGGIAKNLVDDVNFVTATAGGFTPQNQRALLLTWLHTIPFASWLPTRPLMVFEGEKGSGKTVVLKRIQHVLHGRVAPLAVSKSTSDEDLHVALQHNPITCIDNLDTFFDWLADALAAYTTGGVTAKRRRYTDNEMSVLQSHAMLAITTRNPASIRRDDVADRTVVLRVGRRESFRPEGGEGGIFSELNRADLLGEWMRNLNAMIMALRGAPRAATDTRMADYMQLAVVAGQVIGAPVDDAFRALATEQAELAIEADPLVDILRRWVEVKENQNREITSRHLHDELRMMSQLNSLPYPYKSPYGLSRYVRANRTGLARRFKLQISHDPYRDIQTFSFDLL